MRNKVRVLVIDDSASVRQTLVSVLEADPDIEVMGVAPDPFVAARRIQPVRGRAPHSARSWPRAAFRRRFPTSSRWTSRCRAWTASPSCAS